MKKVTCLVLTILVLLLTGSMADYAYGQGGFHGGGGSHGGGGGWHGGGGGWHGGVWIGPGWGWGPWWWGAGYPYYPYNPYNQYNQYYSEPAVIQQQPQEYIQRAPQQEQQYYWYFCPDSKNYYPYVNKCPKGWLKVIPAPAPQDGRE